MTHVLFEENDDRAIMVCGTAVDIEADGSLDSSDADFVGIGGGIIRDGTVKTSVQQFATVDCPKCLDCFRGIHRRSGQVS